MTEGRRWKRAGIGCGNAAVAASASRIGISLVLGLIDRRKISECGVLAA